MNTIDHAPPDRQVIGDTHWHPCCGETITHLNNVLDELESVNKQRNRLVHEVGELTDDLETARQTVRNLTEQRDAARDLARQQGVTIDALGARLDRMSGVGR